MWVQSLGQEDPWEEGTATYCSTLAWRMPWTEESDKLHSAWGCKELDMTEATYTLALAYCPHGEKQKVAAF